MAKAGTGTEQGARRGLRRSGARVGLSFGKIGPPSAAGGRSERGARPGAPDATGIRRLILKQICVDSSEMWHDSFRFVNSTLKMTGIDAW